METYKLISVKKFPQMKINEKKNTIIEGVFPSFTPDPKTEYRFINADYYGFEYYEFNHQILIQDNGIAYGFVHDNPETMPFSSYLKNFTIKCFLNRKGKYAFLASSSFVLTDLMKTCKKNEDLELELDELHLEMPAINQYVDEFLGAWFRGVSSRVTSSALFGSDLENEPLYQQLTNDGAILSSVTISYDNLKIQLNEKAGISTKHIFKNLNDELNLVETLKKYIIDKIKIDAKF